MELPPTRLHEEIEKNKVDRKSAIEILISFIENSDKDDFRVKSIEELEKIGEVSKKIYDLLENLFISDSSTPVRVAAANYLKNRFIEKSLNPMKWAVQHETYHECLSIVFEILIKINDEESKSILIEELKRIRNIKYHDDEKTYINRFRKPIKKLLKSKNVDSCAQEYLADIIMNFKIISTLINKFNKVYYELEHVLITDLDLADGLEVRGTPWQWKNNIRAISEIQGLGMLKNLKKLNLNNNHIKNIKDLIKLKKLTHLFLSNNQIDDIKNIKFIKRMDNLKRLDVDGNGIAKSINPIEFSNVNIIIKKPYFF